MNYVIQLYQSEIDKLSEYGFIIYFVNYVGQLYQDEIDKLSQYGFIIYT